MLNYDHGRDNECLLYETLNLSSSLVHTDACESSYQYLSLASVSVVPDLLQCASKLCDTISLK